MSRNMRTKDDSIRLPDKARIKNEDAQAAFDNSRNVRTENDIASNTQIISDGTGVTRISRGDDSYNTVSSLRTNNDLNANVLSDGTNISNLSPEEAGQALHSMDGNMPMNDVMKLEAIRDGSAYNGLFSSAPNLQNQQPMETTQDIYKQQAAQTFGESSKQVTPKQASKVSNQQGTYAASKIPQQFNKQEASSYKQSFSKQPGTPQSAVNNNGNINSQRAVNNVNSRRTVNSINSDRVVNNRVVKNVYTPNNQKIDTQLANNNKITLSRNKPVSDKAKRVKVNYQRAMATTKDVYKKTLGIAGSAIDGEGAAAPEDKAKQAGMNVGKEAAYAFRKTKRTEIKYVIDEKTGELKIVGRDKKTGKIDEKLTKKLNTKNKEMLSKLNGKDIKGKGGVSATSKTRARIGGTNAKAKINVKNAKKLKDSTKIIDKKNTIKKLMQLHGKRKSLASAVIPVPGPGKIVRFLKNFLGGLAKRSLSETITIVLALILAISSSGNMIEQAAGDNGHVPAAGQYYMNRNEPTDEEWEKIEEYVRAGYHYTGTGNSLTVGNFSIGSPILKDEDVEAAFKSIKERYGDNISVSTLIGMAQSANPTWFADMTEKEMTGLLNLINSEIGGGTWFTSLWSYGGACAWAYGEYLESYADVHKYIEGYLKPDAGWKGDWKSYGGKWDGQEEYTSETTIYTAMSFLYYAPCYVAFYGGVNDGIAYKNKNGETSEPNYGGDAIYLTYNESKINSNSNSPLPSNVPTPIIPATNGGKYSPLENIDNITISSDYHDPRPEEDRGWHFGIDYSVPKGTPVYATESGQIIMARNDPNSETDTGSWIVIEGTQYNIEYLHLSEVFVKEGDIVNGGDLIGKSGDTGCPGNEHLHFTVSVLGSLAKGREVINPHDYLEGTISPSSSADYTSSSNTLYKDDKIIVAQRAVDDMEEMMNGTTENKLNNLTLNGTKIDIPDNLGTYYSITGYGAGMWTSMGAAIASGSKQAEVNQQWIATGSKYTNHIATINGKYLIATTTKFGEVGDEVTFVCKNGYILNCIIADSKGTPEEAATTGGNEWGHDAGKNVVEFEVDYDYYLSHGNPGTDAWFPEIAGGVKTAYIGGTSNSTTDVNTAIYNPLADDLMTTSNIIKNYATGHNGIDYGISEHVPVYATENGTIKAYEDENDGITIILTTERNPNIKIKYTHLQGVAELTNGENIVSVAKSKNEAKETTKVTAGSIIGMAGWTGKDACANTSSDTSQPMQDMQGYMHLEVFGRINGKSYMNPQEYLANALSSDSSPTEPASIFDNSEETTTTNITAIYLDGEQIGLEEIENWDDFDYMGFTTKHIYAGEPKDKDKAEPLEEDVPNFLKPSSFTTEERKDSISITYHIDNSAARKSYYTNTAKAQFLGEPAANKTKTGYKIVGWAFEKDSENIAFDTYQRIDSSIIKKLKKHGNHIDLYAIWKQDTNTTHEEDICPIIKKDNTWYLGTKEMPKAYRNYVSEKDFQVEYAYVDDEGNMIYTDEEDDANSVINKNALYKAILGMATIATDNYADNYTHTYVEYCKRLLKLALNNNTCSIEYNTKIFEGSKKDDDAAVEWTSNGIKYRADRAALTCKVTIYMDSSLNTLLATDKTTATSFTMDSDLADVVKQDTIGAKTTRTWNTLVATNNKANSATIKSNASWSQYYLNINKKEKPSIDLDEIYQNIDDWTEEKLQDAIEKDLKLQDEIDSAFTFSGWNKDNREAANRALTAFTDEEFREMYHVVFPALGAYMDGSDDAAIAFSVLINYGYSAEAACGIMGCLKYLSNFDITLENDSKVGLLQTKEKKLNNFAKRYGEKWPNVSITTQIAFVISELENAENLESKLGMTLDKFKRLEDTDSAAVAYSNICKITGGIDEAKTNAKEYLARVSYMSTGSNMESFFTELKKMCDNSRIEDADGNVVSKKGTGKYIYGAWGAGKSDAYTTTVVDCGGFITRGLVACGIFPEDHLTSFQGTSEINDGYSGNRDCSEFGFTKIKLTSINQLQRGDIIFWTTNGAISHVGAYAGNNKVTDNGDFSWERDIYGTNQLYEYFYRYTGASSVKTTGDKTDDSDIDKTGKLTSYHDIAFIDIDGNYYNGLSTYKIATSTFSNGRYDPGFAASATLPLGTVIKVQTSVAGEASFAHNKYYVIASNAVSEKLQKINGKDCIYIYTGADKKSLNTVPKIYEQTDSADIYKMNTKVSNMMYFKTKY